MRAKSRAERSRLETLGRVGPVRGGLGSEPTRFLSASPLLLLFICAVIAVIVGVVHNRLTTAGKPDPSLTGVRTIIFPFQLGAARAQNGATTFWQWVLPNKDTADENVRLKTEVARLRQENETLRTKVDDTARLRTAMNFVTSAKKPPLVAEVIAILPSTSFDTLTLARGTRDGVKMKMAVRTPEGLIGQVTDVSALTCQVTLLTDTNSGVGVLIQRKGKSQGDGIVRGAGRGLPLDLLYVRRESDIKAGDTVVTSGYGGVFPAGVPLGTIGEVTSDSEGFLKAAKVTPFASQPGMLREGLILR